MGRQLERSLGAHNKDPLYTPLCGQRLQELSQRLGGFGESGGWKCLSGETAESASQCGSGLLELGTQRKRKGSPITLDSDGEEIVQQNKRIRVDACDSERINEEEWNVQEETPGRLERASPPETPAEVLQPVPGSPCDVLPEHIKVELMVCLCCPHSTLTLSVLLFILIFDCFP